MPEPVTLIDARPRFLREPRRGLRRAPQRRRSAAGVVGLLIAAAVLIWAGLAARSLARTRDELRVGRIELRQARTLTSPTDIADATAVPLLAQGAANLAAAGSRLESRTLAPLRYVPLLGRQLRSLGDLSTAGSQAASAVAGALVAAKQAAGGPAQPAARVATVRTFLAVVSSAEARLSRLDLGPRSGLYTSVASARNELAGDVVGVAAGLQRAQAAGAAALDLLEGDHRVLVLLTDPAQMRAGSGIIDELALLHITDGGLALESVQPVGDVPVPAGAVAASGDLAARWGWLAPAQDWQELLASPRFDSTAPLAARMWAAAGKPAVDAVVALDPVALDAILGVTGPVSVGGRDYRAGDVVNQLARAQYQGLGPAAAEPHGVGDVFSAAVAALQAGRWGPERLGLAMAEAARGRHLMVWAQAGRDEAAWTATGASGSLQPTSVVVSLLNRGRVELDPYVQMGAALSVQPLGTHADGAVTVVVRNDVPSGLDSTIAGPAAGIASVLSPGQTVGYGAYVGMLTVSLPGSASDIAVAGLAAPDVQGNDGPTVVVGQQYVVPPGGTLVVTIRFRLPGSTGSLRLEPSGRDPTPFWNFDGEALDAGSSHLVTW